MFLLQILDQNKLPKIPELGFELSCNEYVVKFDVSVNNLGREAMHVEQGFCQVEEDFELCCLGYLAFVLLNEVFERPLFTQFCQDQQVVIIGDGYPDHHHYVGMAGLF